MQTNNKRTCYPRLAGAMIQLNHNVFGVAGDPLVGARDLLDEKDVFQLTGEVLELHPIYSEIFMKHGGPKFARILMEVCPMLTDYNYWIPVKFTAEGPEHRFITSTGKELTPDYFIETKKKW